MRILQWQSPDNYELVLFGDNQEGNRLQYKRGYHACIEYIRAKKNRFGLHMGDEMEALYIDDPRYHPFIIESSPLKQQKKVIEDLRKVAKSKQLIAVLYGNHTDHLFKTIGDITQSTCEDLGVLYGGFSCVVEFMDKHGVQFRGFFSHGKKPIRSIADDPLRRLANEKLQLKQHLKHKFGHCVLMAKGHTHRLIVAEPQAQLYLTTPQNKEGGKYEIKEHYTSYGGMQYIHPDHRWYVNTGSFLKTFDQDVSSYSEMREYDPVELGYVVVEVNNRMITNVRKVVV